MTAAPSGEWAAIVESGKPIYKGPPEPRREADAEKPEPESEWDKIRAAHGHSDYHRTEIFRRCQRRID